MFKLTLQLFASLSYKVIVLCSCIFLLAGGLKLPYARRDDGVDNNLITPKEFFANVIEQREEYKIISKEAYKGTEEQPRKTYNDKKTRSTVLPHTAFYSEMIALRDLYNTMAGPQWFFREDFRDNGMPWNFSTMPGTHEFLHNPCSEMWQAVECACNLTSRPDPSEPNPYYYYMGKFFLSYFLPAIPKAKT